MSLIPIVFEWSGDFMAPLPRFRAQCDKQYVVGECYKLDVIEDRTLATHQHFFACLQTAWKNLPEDIAPRYPTMEALRKRALIKAGYAEERTRVFDTPADAQKAAALIQPLDDYAVILVKGCTVSVFTAKSQSMKAMGKADFQASKTAVLDIVSKLIGVDATTLSAQSPGPREYHPEDQT